MAHVTITLVRPSPVWQNQAKEVLRRIISLQITQPGSLFQGTSDATQEGVVVLLGLWQDREAAAYAAAIPAVRVLRAELATLCGEPLHEEAYDLSGAIRLKDLRATQVA